MNEQQIIDNVTAKLTGDLTGVKFVTPRGNIRVATHRATITKDNDEIWDTVKEKRWVQRGFGIDDNFWRASYILAHPFTK